MCGPDRDWVPFLAAADAAVIDHSSLGLYYALLARPTVAVPVRDRAVNPAAPVAVLRALSPAVSGGGDLAAAVKAVVVVFRLGPAAAVGTLTALATVLATVPQIIKAVQGRAR
jgi:hypothetical protein